MKELVKDDGATLSFSKKWEKKLPEPIEETKSRIDGMSSQELKEKIVLWQTAVANAEKDLENDPKISSLKEELKERSEPYKHAISECLAQVRFACFVLETRGN